MNELAGSTLDHLTPAIVGRAATAGDEAAESVLAHSPECVVLGGSVANLGEQLLAPVRAIVQERCRATPVDRVRIVQAELGADAGTIGAALWAAQQQQAQTEH